MNSFNWLSDDDDWLEDEEEYMRAMELKHKIEAVQYSPGRFNIVPADDNEQEDYFDRFRGCMYDIFYLTDKGKQLLAGQMQRHCDGEGELWLSGLLPETDNVLNAIVEAWNATYSVRLNYFFKVSAMD